VEGQETRISRGFSHSNVPFDFIQEVQVKTSGIEAEHAVPGGVVNVIMKKGSNNFHGSVFGQFENQPWMVRRWLFSATTQFTPQPISALSTTSTRVTSSISRLSPNERRSSRIHVRRPDPKGSHLLLSGFNPE